MTSTSSADIDGGIVVGHDGSEAAARATRWAAKLAAKLGVRLHVVRAWSMQTAPRPASATLGYVPPMTDFEEAVLKELENDVASLGLPPDVPMTCHALHGPPSRRLLEAASRADLLVVGSRGKGGFRGLLLGSTADQLTRHATCPVTVVPATAADRMAAPDSGPQAPTQ